MDIEEFSDFGEVNDDLERLHDIIDRNDDDNDIDDLSDNGDINISKASKFDKEECTDDFLKIYDSLQSWSWDMKLSDRLNAVSAFLRNISYVLGKLKTSSEEYISEARLHRAQVGGVIYRKADVVGCTVVGASRRLEAIRAAQPFAVLVEEACECLEPTLMSVLTVKSLRKLELIGDHRQLPAFVQNCWYNLEITQPSIKTSLFERLVTGKIARNNVSHKKNQIASIVPMTVLDEQRRMRPLISDITRSYYDDLVSIQDHPHTLKQNLGDKISSKIEISHFNMYKELFQSSSKIPGMQSCIYFWNISNNKEGRPIAGTMMLLMFIP